MLPANRGMLVLSYHFIWQSLENERCGCKTKRGVTQWYLQNDEPVLAKIHSGELLSCQRNAPCRTFFTFLHGSRHPSFKMYDGAERLVVFTIFTRIIALFGVN